MSQSKVARGLKSLSPRQSKRSASGEDKQNLLGEDVTIELGQEAVAHAPKQDVTTRFQNEDNSNDYSIRSVQGGAGFPTVTEETEEIEIGTSTTDHNDGNTHDEKDEISFGDDKKKQNRRENNNIIRGVDNVFLTRIKMVEEREVGTFNLGDEDLPDFMEHGLLYQMYWRMLVPFLLSLYIVIVYNSVGADTFSDDPVDLKQWEFVLLAASGSCTIGICITVFCLALYYQYWTKQVNTFDRGILKVLHPYLLEMEKKEFESLQIYCFKTEKNMIVFCIFALLYSAIDLLIASFAKNAYDDDVDCDKVKDIYYDMYWNKGNYTSHSTSEGFNDYKNSASLCAVMRSSYITTYSFVICFTCIAFMCKQTEKCTNDILKRKNQFSQPLLKNIKIKIQDTLTIWRNNHSIWKIQLEKRPAIWIAVCFGTFLWHFAVSGARLGVFWSFTPSCAVCCVLFYILDSIVAILIFKASVRIVAHFKFPSIIMHCFNLEYEQMYKDDKLKIGNVTLLIDWWELRQFYIYVIIHHYASDFREYITVGVIGTGIMITIMLTLWDCNGFDCISDFDIEQVFLVWTLYIIGLTLALTYNGTLYVHRQKKHLSMLNLLKLISIERGIEGITGSDGDNINAVDVIQSDVENRLYTMKVLGVSIDDNFLLGLRGAVIAFLLSLLIEMLT